MTPGRAGTGTGRHRDESAVAGEGDLAGVVAGGADVTELQLPAVRLNSSTARPHRTKTRPLLPGGSIAAMRRWSHRDQVAVHRLAGGSVRSAAAVWRSRASPAAVSQGRSTGWQTGSTRRARTGEVDGRERCAC